MFNPELATPAQMRGILPAYDHKTAKDVLMTDRERVWLAGLLSEHLSRIAGENPGNAVQASDCMNDLAWGMKLKRRLWEGVEL